MDGIIAVPLALPGAPPPQRVALEVGDTVRALVGSAATRDLEVVVGHVEQLAHGGHAVLIHRGTRTPDDRIVPASGTVWAAGHSTCRIWPAFDAAVDDAIAASRARSRSRGRSGRGEDPDPGGWAPGRVRV